MATCKIGEFKLSLNMNEFRSKVGFPTFYSFFFVYKATHIKAKENKSKPPIVSLSSFCQDKSARKITCHKKIKYFPSFVCLLHGKREPAAVLESNYNGANNSGPYRIFSTKLE